MGQYTSELHEAVYVPYPFYKFLPSFRKCIVTFKLDFLIIRINGKIDCGEKLVHKALVENTEHPNKLTPSIIFNVLHMTIKLILTYL